MKTDDSINQSIYGIIKHIVFLIKHEDNYIQAANLLKSNKLSIHILCENTYKLSQINIAKLTDAVINKK